MHDSPLAGFAADSRCRDKTSSIAVYKWNNIKLTVLLKQSVYWISLYLLKFATYCTF